MHFHFSGMLNVKKVRNSALLLILVLVVIFVVDKLTALPDSARLYLYVIPFIAHMLASIFLKQRESWIVGGIVGTLVSMAGIVVATLVL